MKFSGYCRCDGKVGIRNHVLILPVSICASDMARKVHEQVSGTVTFHNHLGCSQSPYDQVCTIRTMAGLAANPNVYGTILISLGCENCQLDIVAEAIRQRTNKPLVMFSLQQCGGYAKTFEQACKAADSMVLAANKIHRTQQDFNQLIVATECGGSDATSGLAANPLIGLAMDQIIEDGGSVILSETTEMIGAESLLKQRARTQAIAHQIDEIIARYEESQKVIGYDVRERNPSPGNKAGGITTLEEKSLGCILKAGHKPIESVVDYAEEVKTKGLVIMDTPGNDATSMMGMVAGGCQLIVFSTGRGTPMGHPLVPVIKLCANPKTCESFHEHIDFDASSLLEGRQSFNEAKQSLIETMLEVIQGKQTQSERLDFYETAIVRVGKYVKAGKIYSYYV